MAAARPCASCGVSFSPRKDSSAYCPELACRRQRKRDLQRELRASREARLGISWPIEAAAVALIERGEIEPTQGLLLVLFPPARLREAA